MSTSRKWPVSPKAMVLAFCLAGVSVVSAQTPEPTTSIYAFGPGEQASYKVAYLGITAGSAIITVGAEMTQYGRTVWPIVTMARTDSVAAVYPVKDKFVTYWDYEAQRSVGSDLFADENRKRRRQRVTMNHGSLKAKVIKQKEGDAESETEHDISPNALDVAAAMFALRNQPISVGQSYRFPVFTGDRSFELEGLCEGKQTLRTELGAQEVYKLRIRAQFSGKLEARRDMFLFVTTDPKHLPVRVEAELALGYISAEITDYKPGREIALRATDGGAKATAASTP
jgi:hypothetical protein